MLTVLKAVQKFLGLRWRETTLRAAFFFVDLVGFLMVFGVYQAGFTVLLFLTKLVAWFHSYLVSQFAGGLLGWVGGSFWNVLMVVALALKGL